MSKFISIEKGTKINKWTVGDPVRKNGRVYYHCVCECGKEKDVLSYYLRHNIITSCGCDKVRAEPTEDLTGKDFGYLHAEERVIINNRIFYRCRCKCGGEIVISGSDLKNRVIKSCGCRIGIRENVKSYHKDGTFVLRIKKNSPTKKNTSGYPGVTWVDGMQKWTASITFKGKRRHLGCFNNKEDAINARKVAEEKYFAKFLKEISDEPSRELLKNVGFGGTKTDEEIAALEEKLMPRRNKDSGCVGVTWSKSLNKWKTSIYVDKRQIQLGLFDNLEDAIATRKAAEEWCYKDGKDVADFVAKITDNRDCCNFKDDAFVDAADDEEEDKEEDFIGFEEGWDDDESNVMY